MCNTGLHTGFVGVVYVFSGLAHTRPHPRPGIPANPLDIKIKVYPIPPRCRQDICSTSKLPYSLDF